MSENLYEPPVLVPAEPVIMAIDNGGANTRLAFYQGNKNLGGAHYPTPGFHADALQTLANLKNVILGPKTPVDAIGFAIAGQVDQANGTIVSGGRLQANDWCAQPLRQTMAARMGIDETMITMLNDCDAAAKAQSAYNRVSGETRTGYVERINVGLGGARFIISHESAKPTTVVDDELGHHVLRKGALCGCGKDGCAEAYISGSGIEERFGISSEYLRRDQRRIVVADAVATQVSTLERFEDEGFEPGALYFYGDLLVSSSWIIKGVRAGLAEKAAQRKLPFLPKIRRAAFGNDSTILGARFTARQMALAA